MTTPIPGTVNETRLPEGDTPYKGFSDARKRNLLVNNIATCEILHADGYSLSELVDVLNWKPELVRFTDLGPCRSARGVYVSVFDTEAERKLLAPFDGCPVDGDKTRKEFDYGKHTDKS